MRLPPYCWTKTTRLLWLGAFIYIFAISFLFQRWLLPRLPTLDGGSGLIRGDAVLYQHFAVQLAQAIQTHGWSAWSLWSPQTNMAANVTLLGALYAFFSTTSPVWVIPVNAAIQATSACLIAAVAREVWPASIGRRAGLGGSLLFILMPSALTWYSQPLKDCYLIMGALLVLHALLLAIRPGLEPRRTLILLIQTIAGIAVIVAVKPYYLRLLLIWLPLAMSLVGGMLARHKHAEWPRVLGFFLLVMLLVGSVFHFTKPYVNETGVQYDQWQSAQDNERQNAVGADNLTGWSWHPSWLPSRLDHYAEILAKTRAGFIQHNRMVGAGSLVDGDHAPDSVSQIFGYLPRALTLAVLAPFPQMLLNKHGLTSKLALLEMLVCYLLVPGVLFAVRGCRPPMLALIGSFSLFFLVIFGFVTPNMGTLLRYRYLFEILLMMTGLAGWLSAFEWRKKQRETCSVPPQGHSDAAPVFRTGKKKLVKATFLVSALTLVTSLGFFLRDIYMARIFGAGHALDVFFMATMLPMFFVTTFSIPAGTAFLPAYAQASKEARDKARQLIGSAYLLLTLLLICLALLLYCFFPTLFALFKWHPPGQHQILLHDILLIYLLMLVLSGLIVISNAVLNAEGRVLYSALAQLVVPATTVIAIMMFSRAEGIIVVAYGMLVGQMLNFLLVVFAIGRQGLLKQIGAMPLYAFNPTLLREYGYLIVAALSTALLVPTANVLASHLQPGSVAIIGLGIKVMVLVTGIVGMGINTVILPHFSGLIAQHHHERAQFDLSFFLLLVTLMSVPMALVSVWLSAPIVHLVFAHSALSERDLYKLIEVVGYGLIQLPFFTCGLIMQKYLAASKRSGIIFWAALLGFVLMLSLGGWFAEVLGVPGIALAMTLSVAMATFILVGYAVHIRALPLGNAVFAIANLAAGGFLVIAFNHGGRIGELPAFVGCLLFFGLNWRPVMRRLRHTL